MWDKNQMGGAIMHGAGTVFANGLPVGLHCSPITPHFPYIIPTHLYAVTTNGSPTVFVEGQPVLRVGSGNTCGDTIIEGSPNIFVP